MNRARALFRVSITPITVLTFAALVTLAVVPVMGDEHRPRVFITDSESWEVAGSAAGSGGTFASHSQGGARPQTAEIIKTFGERCPQIVVNNKQEKADYVVVLDHEGGKGYLLRRNKIAVFNKDGDAIVSRSTRSLGNSVQDGCEAIVADWGGHSSTTPLPQTPGSALLPQSSPKPTPQEHPASVMPAAKAEIERPTPPKPVPATATEKAAAAAPGVTIGTVSVTSDPDGADIFIDSVGYGHSPAILKLPPGKHTVQLVKQNYKDWTSNLEVKENSIVNVTAKLQK
jgi:PEGA domain